MNNVYIPPVGWRNAHMQTILASSAPRTWIIRWRFRKYNEKAERLLLDGGDGVRLLAYWNQAGKTKSDDLAILIHGWEGSADSTYIKSMAKRLLDNGIDVVRLNMRDHGDTHHLNKEIFNSTLVEEVQSAIVDLQSRLNYQRYSLVGFSLGGNFSLRVAARADEHTLRLDRVIAFCPVIDGQQSSDVLSLPKNWLYERVFVRKWKRSLRKKNKHFPEYSLHQELKSLRSLDAMNERLIPKYTRFTNTESYFKAYTLTGNALAETICPCYLHFARDDMIIPIEGLAQIERNANLDITISEHGGHCGYILDWCLHSWQDVRALSLLT